MDMREGEEVMQSKLSNSYGVTKPTELNGKTSMFQSKILQNSLP